MIVQSPNQRSQGGVIPAGLSKPSMGSRPPAPMGMPKPKPPTAQTKPAYSPLGGMTNPLAGAVKPVAKNFTGQTMPAEVVGGSAVPVMQAEVVRPNGPVRPTQSTMQPAPELEAEVSVEQQPFVPDRNFRNRESWDNWRRGRSYLTGGAQL